MRIRNEFRLESPEIDVGFLLHPKFWRFQKHAFLHILTYLFKTNYCFVIYKVQSFKMVLSLKSLLEKDLY